MAGGEADGRKRMVPGCAVKTLFLGSAWEAYRCVLLAHVGQYQRPEPVSSASFCEATDLGARRAAGVADNPDVRSLDKLQGHVVYCT